LGDAGRPLEAHSQTSIALILRRFVAKLTRGHLPVEFVRPRIEKLRKPITCFAHAKAGSSSVRGLPRALTCSACSAVGVRETDRVRLGLGELLGVVVEQEVGGSTVWHSGRIEGFNTRLGHDPASGITVAVLANLEMQVPAQGAATRLGRKLMSIGRGE